MKLKFFKTPAAFRGWLERHHADTTELWVGFYKRASGKGGISYQDGVDAALCYGWIDGIKKRVDEERYTHRFTPRRDKSIWSRVNTRRMTELITQGLVAPPGMKAFEKRDAKRTGVYTFENSPKVFPPSAEKRFRANSQAWEFFRAQPPGYQKLVTGWIANAKKEETQRKRLDLVLDACAKGTRVQWM